MEEENGDYWLLASTKEKMLKIVVRELVSNIAETISGKEGGIITFLQEK
jgi:hypothetical protein